MIHLDYRDARPIYAQITEQFKRQIEAGVLREGEKLPSVRELAGSLAINPNTIQRAYRELEQQGWIVSVSGKGSFVCDVPSQDGKWSALDAAVASLLQKGVSMDEVIAHLREGGKKNA